MRAHVTVTKSTTFDAAHVLAWHPGPCSRLHGHTYTLEVSVTGPLNENGIVIDFGDLSRAIDELVTTRVDHRLLNDVIDNPTAENIACTALSWLVEGGVPVSRLTVWETATSSATVYGDKSAPDG